MPPNTFVRIVCQTFGQWVTGTYGSSEVWDYIVVQMNGHTYEGFAADVNIYTGSNGFVAESCR